MITDIFCKILNKELPADIVMEGEDWVAFNDINPQAPVHVLIVPKKHGPLMERQDGDANSLGNLLLAANKVAKKLKIDEKGFRLIINCGEDSQAEILSHLHIHLLAGKKLGTKIVNDPK